MMGCNCLQGAFSSGGGGGGTTPLFFIPNWCDGASSNTNLFNSFWANVTYISSATESAVDITMTNAFTIIRHQANLITNTKNGTVTLSFRDDASSIQTLSITASTTGQFDSGEVDIDVAADSLCNYNRDSTGASSGTHSYVEFVSCNPS